MQSMAKVIDWRPALVGGLFVLTGGGLTGALVKPQPSP
jgi:hypothetical protein